MIKKEYKAAENKCDNSKAEQRTGKGTDIKGIVHSHIKRGEDQGDDGGDAIQIPVIFQRGEGKFLIYIKVKYQTEQKKNNGENISRFHTSCFHQCPGGEKTFDGLQGRFALG